MVLIFQSVKFLVGGKRLQPFPTIIETSQLNKDSTMIIHAKLKKSILVNFSGDFKKDRIVLKKLCRMFKSLTIADIINF